MVLMEGNGRIRSNGWPLGLGNVNYRISMVDTSDHLAAPHHTYTSRILRSSSFSSFSSSNLDTESTVSFFQDQSVSLGRLMGIRPANKGRLYCEQHLHRYINIPDERPDLVVHKSHENSQGICVPMLLHVIGKMSRSGRQ